MDCIDLFCGCGGLSKGFLNAGFNIVAAYENWDAAIQCYKKNFNHNIYKLDLHDWEKAADNIKNIKPSIIIGGPPCQDFSPAGNRIEGKRAQLTVQCHLDKMTLQDLSARNSIGVFFVTNA